MMFYLVHSWSLPCDVEIHVMCCVTWMQLKTETAGIMNGFASCSLRFATKLLSALAHVSHGNKKREPLQKEIGHIPLIYVLLTKTIGRMKCYSAKTVQASKVSIASVFFALWFVPQPVSPSSANLVISSLRICTASKHTIATGWKDFALMSFFEGGSTMLLIEGTRANQVKVCTCAPCSAK